MANLTLRSPFADLQREVDRLFDSFVPFGEKTDQVMWTPTVDVWETNDAYHFAVDLPGLAKKDVDISYTDGTLQISGERVRMSDEDYQYHHFERPFGRFFRSIRLDRGVDVDGIEASFQDGVLSIVVPKTEDSKPRRIEIS